VRELFDFECRDSSAPHARPPRCASRARMNAETDVFCLPAKVGVTTEGGYCRSRPSFARPSRCTSRARMSAETDLLPPIGKSRRYDEAWPFQSHSLPACPSRCTSRVRMNMNIDITQRVRVTAVQWRSDEIPCSSSLRKYQRYLMLSKSCSICYNAMIQILDTSRYRPLKVETCRF